jgi:LCP family protein required for cell wall assembly
VTDVRRPRNRRVRAVAGTYRHAKVRRVTAGRRILTFLGAALAVLLVSGSSVAAIAYWDVSRGFGQSVDLGGGAAPVGLGEFPGAVNMLLVGSDSRVGFQGGNEGYDSSGALNDVNMLLHISADHTSATVVSFPRDTMVPIPSCPDGKGGHYDAMSLQPLNSAIGYGGLPCVVLTIEKLTGLDIPYAGLIGFNGVINMANAVGGAEVCVAQAITDPESPIHLTAGMHTLTGEDALMFLRMRHGIGDGSDLARIGGQQAFMSSLARKIMSAQTLTDLPTVYNLAKITAQSLTLSSNIANVPALASLAWTARNVDVNNIAFIRYPVMAYAENPNKVVPDPASAKVVIAAIEGDNPVQFTANSTNGVTVEPTPTPVSTSTSTPTPTPSATPEPAPSATATGSATPGATPSPAPTVVALPENAVGQLATQTSCVG